MSIIIQFTVACFAFPFRAKQKATVSAAGFEKIALIQKRGFFEGRSDSRTRLKDYLKEETRS